MNLARLSAGAGADGAAKPYSAAVEAGGLLFLTGQIGVDARGALVAGGVAAQTRQALANVAAILGEHGLSWSDVAKCNVWITDEEDFAAYNAVYQEVVGPHFPARSTMICKLLGGAMVEVEAIAALRSPEG